MKPLVFLLFLSISFQVNAQSAEEIIGFFQKKAVDSIVAYAAFPFEDSCDHQVISDPIALTKHLNDLFIQSDRFKSIEKLKIEQFSSNRYGFTIHVYDEKGEPEGGSSLSFEFERVSEGYRLKRIFCMEWAYDR